MSMTSADQLYQPDPRNKAQLHAFIRHCEESTGIKFTNYAAFEAFTVSRFRTFWALFLDWAEIICDGDRDPVCTEDDCESAVFFPNIRLNYAENLLRDGANALIGCHVDNNVIVTRKELRERVRSLARFLQELGVEPGDRVAAIARNNIEVIIAALASAAIGAIFSSCAHDMGAFTVLSRFQQLKPKILIANCASQPWDVGQSLTERVTDVVAGLPSLTDIITIDGSLPGTAHTIHTFAQAIACSAPDFVWQRFPFNHPLFILFSSGTTGPPKCIIHGAGGTLLEHVKEHRLHGDLGQDDRLFFQTSCGWMMWNWQLSALACGAEVVVYDGALQGPETLWQLVAKQHVTVFGTNPAYLQFTEAAGYSPRCLDLSALRSVLSTGSILYPKQFDWIIEHVKPLPVQSISGGTDILGCFVLGNPLLPVYRGQAQCRSLGLDVRSLPEYAIGELICANPFPSRPVGFYGETSNARYHDTYFSQNPGVWTHGDLIELTPHGAIMHGRSDGVINIRGVRIGPAEIYRILQQIPTIIEAMAVEQTHEDEAGGARLILLVVLRAGAALDAALITRIRLLLMQQGNAMMVPATIIQMSELPVTHSGKRSEAAARDAVNGRSVRNRSALLNPECLDRLSDKAAPAPVELGMIHGDLEQALCAICQRRLNIPIVDPADNFLAFGGDSITILGFLIEVADRTETAIPLQALLGVSTIRDLVQLLSTGVASLHATANAPDIRPVGQDDKAEVSRLLDEGHGIGLQWHWIFDHPWQPEGVPRGLVLTAGGNIVGFIGLIGAIRTINGKSGVICNLSSWYVRPAFRGWSNALMAAATQFEVTYTALTPQPVTRHVLRAMGFHPYDGAKRVLLPLMDAGTLRGIRPSLIFEPVEMQRYLDDEHRRILHDHAGYKCEAMLLIDGDESSFVMFAYRNVYRGIPYSQILYCSVPTVLYRHFERVKLTIMRRQRTIGLMVSERLSRNGVKIASHTMFRSAVFGASELDKLYSEAVFP